MIRPSFLMGDDDLFLLAVLKILCIEIAYRKIIFLYLNHFCSTKFKFYYCLQFLASILAVKYILTLQYINNISLAYKAQFKFSKNPHMSFALLWWVVVKPVSKWVQREKINKSKFSHLALIFQYKLKLKSNREKIQYYRESYLLKFKWWLFNTACQLTQKENECDVLPACLKNRLNDWPNL